MLRCDTTRRRRTSRRNQPPLCRAAALGGDDSESAHQDRCAQGRGDEEGGEGDERVLRGPHPIEK